MNSNGPVSTPSSSRSYARCLTRPPPGESTNNNAETTQQHRDENLLKKTSLKLRSRVVKKSADPKSTPVSIPTHQPKSELKPDVDYFEEEPDLRQIDCHGNKEDFSRDAQVEEEDNLEVFQPAWLRQRENRTKDEGEADGVDTADDKMSGVKRKKKSKACKLWRMKVHNLKDTDEEEDKVHFAPTWMKKIPSKSDDIIATKATADCENGPEFKIRNDEVGTKLKASLVLERSAEELIDSIESYDERVHCRVELEAETSSTISCPEEDTVGSVKENAKSSSERSVQHNAPIGQRSNATLGRENDSSSSFQIEHAVSCVGDTCSTWSQDYHPEFETQLNEFIFQVLLRAVVSLLVEEVAMNSLKENAEQGESKATGWQDGDSIQITEQRINTHRNIHRNDAIVHGIVSNEDGTVYNKSNNNTSQMHDVVSGKSAACGGKFTLGCGSNRQSEVQLINTNSTMTSTTAEPGEVMTDRSQPGDESSTPLQNLLNDASSRGGSPEAKTAKDDGDSSFESVFGEETLIDDCLQEDARENGYAASVAILDGGEEDGLVADVRLLWILDEDEDDLEGDKTMDGYRGGVIDDGIGSNADDEEEGEEWERKEEDRGDEDVADGIDIDDGEDELMTDVRPPWESMDFLNFSDHDNSTDEDLQQRQDEPGTSHPTILDALDCKIKGMAGATDNSTVMIYFKNLTHILTNPGRDGRRPQIILELDVLMTPGHFEKRRLEFYRFAEKLDKGKLRFRKPFKRRPKKYCRKVCEAPSSGHSQDEEDGCEVVRDDHRVTKGKNRKKIHKNLLRKSRLPKWKKVKKWFR